MTLPSPVPSYKSREHPLSQWNVSGCFSPLEDHQAPVLTVSHTNVQAGLLSSAPFAPPSLVTCLGQIEWSLGVNTGAGRNEKNWLASSLAWLLPSFCPSYSLPPSLPPRVTWTEPLDVSCSSCPINQWSFRNQRHISLPEWLSVSPTSKPKFWLQFPRVYGEKDILILAPLVKCHGKYGVLSSVLSSCLTPQVLPMYGNPKALQTH